MEETSLGLLSFDPSRAPVLPRHAATVVVMRAAPVDAGQALHAPDAGGGDGIEVFCVLRHQRSGFLGGAVVFPGGKVEAADGAPAWDDPALATAPHPRGLAMIDGGAGGTHGGVEGRGDAGPPAVTARALAVAACRETFEEAGLLPVDPPLDAAGVDALRLEVAAAPGGLPAVLARHGMRLRLDRLTPWARWVTPEAEGRRFDARFFLLELPAGQVGRHDDHETTMSFWATPSAVLARAARGEIFLAPPTTRTLELLVGAADVGAAHAIAARQSLLPICPLFVPAGFVGTDGDAPFLALPGDPRHPVRERRVEGTTRFVLRDGRFVGEEPPPEPATST